MNALATLKKRSPSVNTLTQHPKPKVKTWAEKTLKELKIRYSSETESQVKNQTENQTSPSKDIGFVPFEPSLQPPNIKPQKDAGFVPFEPPQKKPSIDAELKSSGSETSPKDLKVIKKPNIIQPRSSAENTLNSTTPETDLQPEKPRTEEQVENEPSTAIDRIWKQADRATQWRRLKPLKLTRFYLEQALTVFVLIKFTPWLIELLMDTANNLFLWLPFVNPLQLFYRDPTQFVYISFAVLFVLSPWLLDGLLKLAYGMKPLPMTTLFKHSQEANRILRSYCQKRNWKVPTLQVLPTNAPIAMTYGCWPRFAQNCCESRITRSTLRR